MKILLCWKVWWCYGCQWHDWEWSESDPLNTDKWWWI